MVLMEQAKEELLELIGNYAYHVGLGLKDQAYWDASQALMDGFAKHGCRETGLIVGESVWFVVPYDVCKEGCDHIEFRGAVDLVNEDL